MRYSAGFEVYPELLSARRHWRWRLKAINGRIIADGGEAYSSQGNATKACRRLMILLGTDGYALPIEVLDD